MKCRQENTQRQPRKKRLQGRQDKTHIYADKKRLKDKPDTGWTMRRGRGEQAEDSQTTMHDNDKAQRQKAGKKEMRSETKGKLTTTSTSIPGAIFTT